MGALLVQATAHAQAWREALEAGEHVRAAALLHPLVIEGAAAARDDDPAAPRALAVLYGSGLGVERDTVLACALARYSRFAWDAVAPRLGDDIAEYERRIAEADRFAEESCSGLSSDERRLADQSIGCFGFGLSEHVVQIGPHRLHVSRRGLSVDGRATAPFDAWGCPALFAGIRGHVVPPPADALPGVAARHVIEVLSWHRLATATRYFLRWILAEVTAEGVAAVTAEDLAGTSTWPGTPLASEFAPTVSFQMLRTGHIRWRVEGDPPRRGVLPRADGADQ